MSVQVRGSKVLLASWKIGFCLQQKILFLHLLTFTDEKHVPDLFVKEPLQLFSGRIIMNLSKLISANQEDNLHIIQSSMRVFYF